MHNKCKWISDIILMYNTPNCVICDICSKKFTLKKPLFREAAIAYSKAIR